MSKQYGTAIRRIGTEKLLDLQLEESREAAVGLTESYNAYYPGSTRPKNYEMVVVELKVIG